MSLIDHTPLDVAVYRKFMRNCKNFKNHFSEKKYKGVGSQTGLFRSCILPKK